MTRKIEELSDEELQKELSQSKTRQDEIHAEQLRRKDIAHAKRTEALREHVTALLALVPEHSRTSCSDTNPSNTHRWCTRCALLELQDEWNTLPDGMDIIIRLERV